MKKLTFCILLSVMVIATKAQILKEQSFVLSDSSILSYLTNQDKKDGLYVIKKNQFEIARGNYLNNRRVGNWYFFNNDKSLFLRYNYDEKKLLFVDEKTLALGSVIIKASDNENVDRRTIPIPIFSMEQYFVLAFNAAKKAIPSDQIQKLKGKNVSVIAKISKDGSPNYFVNYEFKNKMIEKEIYLDNALNIEWLPSSYDGKSYDSEFKITSKISLDKDSDMHKRIDWSTHIGAN